MNLRRLRLWLAVFLLIVAVGILVVSFSPETRLQQVLPMPPVILPTGTPQGYLTGWGMF